MALLRFQAQFGSTHRPVRAIEVWDLEYHLLGVLDEDLLTAILMHYFAGAALSQAIAANAAETQETERKELQRMTKPTRWKKRAQAVVLLALSLTLPACSSAITMRHPDGRETNCGSHAFWAPAVSIRVPDRERQCIADFKDQGYVRMP